MAQNDDKAELILELAKARNAISANVTGLRHDLDFPTRAKRAFKKHPALWLGAAAVAGLVIARVVGRPKEVVKVKVFSKKDEDSPVEKAGKAGLVLGALKVAFDLARPALMRYATQFATQRVSEYMSARQQAPYS